MPYGIKRRRYSMPAPVRGYGLRTRPGMRKAGMMGKGVPARVHTFRRLGTPFVLQSNGTGSLPLVNGSVGGSATAGLQLGNLSSGAVINTTQFGGAFNFQLSHLSASNDLISVFDNYRIKSVRLRFDFSMNSAPTGDGASTLNLSLPLIHYAQDNDDAVVPGTVTEVLQNGYSKCAKLDRPFYVTVKPRAQSAGYSLNGSGVPVVGATGMANPLAWLDCDAPTVQHFGLKMWLKDVTGGGLVAGQSTWALTVTPTYYLEFKNVI